MKLFSKRCLAVLLVLMLVLSNTTGLSLLASADTVNDSDVTLGDVIVKNYDDLSEAEKVILSSGKLSADIAYQYTAPTAEDNLIVVTEDQKLVTVEAYKSGDFTWIPVSFDIVVDGTAVNDDIALTKDGDDYVGNYTYDENMFSVVVTYVLDVEASADAQLDLLNAAAALNEDIQEMQKIDEETVYSVTLAGVVVELTPLAILDYLTSDELPIEVPGMEGSAIDMIYALSQGYEIDLGNGIVIEIPDFGRKSERDAAANLKGQQDDNGDLDLVKLFADHPVSYLEMLLVYGDELEAALTGSYEDIDEILGGLEGTLEYLEEDLTADVRGMVYEEINDTLAGYEDALAEMEIELPYIDSEEDLADAIGILKTFVSDTLTGLNDEVVPLLNELNAELEYPLGELEEVESTGDLSKVTDYVLDIVALMLEGSDYGVVENADDLQVVIDDLEKYIDDLLSDVHDTLYAAFGLSVSTTEDLLNAIDALEDEQSAVLTDVNAFADEYSSILGNMNIQKASDMDALIARIQPYASSERMEELAYIQEYLAYLEEIIPALEEVYVALVDAEAAVETLKSFKELLTALDEAQTGLAQVETAIDALEEVQNTLTDLDAQVEAAVSDYVSGLNMLIELLDSFLGGIEDVNDRFEDGNWNVLNDEILDADADYAAITEAATGITKTYDADDVTTTLNVDETTVQYNMSMYNVTINVNGSYIDGTEPVALEQFQVVVTFRKGATAEEIQAEIDEAVEGALTVWSGIDNVNYVAAYDELNLPAEGLSSDLIYNVTYAPKMFTITTDGDYGIDPELPYGYELVLPGHKTEGMAYSYVVNGKRMNQGKTITITEALEITRTEGSADQYKTITDLIQNTDVVSGDVESFLNNSALDKGGSFWLEIPADADGLIDLSKLRSDKQIVVSTQYDSALGDLVWVPVSGYTVNADGEKMETLTFTNGVATVEDIYFENVYVTYELTLTTEALAGVGIESDAIVLQMNLQGTLAGEYADQKAALELLVSQLGRLAQVGDNIGMVGGLVGAVDEATAALIQKAIDQTNNNPSGQLSLYDLLNSLDADGDGKVSSSNMLYYYQNDDAFQSEIEFMLDMLDAIENDPVLSDMLETFEDGKYMETFNELSAQIRSANLSVVNGVIDTTNTTGLSGLLEKLDQGYNGKTYTAADLADLTWTAQVKEKGPDSVNVDINVTYQVDDNVYTGTVELRVGAELTANDIAKINAALDAQIAEYVAAFGAVNETYYSKVENLLTVGHVVTGTESVSVVLTAKTYTVVIEGEADQTVSVNGLTITLPGTSRAGIQYVYTILGKTVNVGAEDTTYTFTAADLAAIAAAGSVTITRETVDVATQSFVEFVEGLGDAAVLVENEDGSFSIVLRVDPANTASMGDFAMGMFMGGYGYIGMGSGDLYVDGQYHLQTLVDTILTSGVGTETVIGLIDANGSIQHMSLGGIVYGTDAAPTNLGGKVLQTTMTLGTSKDDQAARTVDFYVTLAGAPAALTQVRNALVRVQNYIKVTCENGMVNATVTLPGIAYEAYLAALTLTGETDIHSIDQVNGEVALGYLISLVNGVLEDENVTLETFANTAAMFGYDASAVTKYQNYYEKALSYYNSEDLVYGDNSVTLPFDNLPITAIVNRLQSYVDGMTASMGVTIDLSTLIYEYNTGLDFSVSAELTNIGTDYVAAYVDVYGDGYTNKVGMLTAGELASKVSSLAGASVVVLLDDYTGSLSFSTTTILDLKGHTVDGSITSTGNLIIVDSYYNAENPGTVTGNVSGATILGGKYLGDISGCLDGGYVKGEDGVVYNKLFTISGTGNDITVTLNLTPSDVKELASRQGVMDLAVELVMDLVINHYSTAALTVEGSKIYDVNVDDIVGIYAGSDRLNTVIDMALTWISAPELAALFNTVVADLTDFEALAAALEGDGVVASYGMDISRWELVVERAADGDYLTASVGSAEAVENGTLSIVVDGAYQDELADVAGALADTVTVESELTLEEIVRNGKTFPVVGTYTGSVVVDFAKDPNYVIMMAVVLANGNPDLKDALVTGIKAYYEEQDLNDLETAFNKLTVQQVITSLENTGRNETFTSMVEALGLTGTVTGIDDTAMGLDLVIDLMGVVLRRVSVDLDGTFGALLKRDTEGDKYYGGAPERTVTVSRTFRGYEVTAELDVAVDVKIYLFPDHVHTYGDPVWNWADDYSAATATFTCAVCDHEVVVPATVELTTDEPATTEKPGTKVYTATAIFEGKEYTDTKTVNTPAALPTVILSALNANANVLSYSIDNENGILYIDTLKDGITAEEFKNILVVDYTNDVDSTVEITFTGAVNGLVPTASQLVLTAENSDGATATATYGIVVLGDTNCNGRIENNDSVLIALDVVDIQDLVDLPWKAGDVNQNGYLENNDGVWNCLKVVDIEEYIDLQYEVIY